MIRPRQIVLRLPPVASGGVASKICTAGKSAEAIVDRERAKVIFVVIELEEGFGERHQTRIAVPWGSLQLDLDPGDSTTPYLLELSPAELRTAPRFDRVSFRKMCMAYSQESSAVRPHLLWPRLG